jgi:hypothetical protein
MYALEYHIGNRVVEKYTFPTKALCVWKRKQLAYNGTHRAGTFIISRV